MHLGPFDEFAPTDLIEKIFDTDEVVVTAIFLPRTRRTRRTGDRQAQLGIVRQEQPHQRRLAGSGRRRHDEKMSAHCARTPFSLQSEILPPPARRLVARLAVYGRLPPIRRQCRFTFRVGYR